MFRFIGFESVLMSMTFTLGLFISSTSYGGPGNGGGGGGLATSDGRFVTFGTAKIPLKNDPIETVPGLNMAMKSLTQLSLPGDKRGILIGALVPSETRQYFQLENDEFPKNARDVLIAEYKKVTKDKSNSTYVVYAFTDDKRNTYLLPEFLNLSEIEQASILFHESLWVVDYSLSYDFVIRAEVKFQNFTEKSLTNPNLVYDGPILSILKSLFKSPYLSVLAAVRQDQISGYKTDLSLNDLFGTETMKLALEYYRSSYAQEWWNDPRPNVGEAPVHFNDHGKDLLDRMNAQLTEHLALAKMKEPNRYVFHEFYNMRENLVMEICPPQDGYREADEGLTRMWFDLAGAPLRLTETSFGQMGINSKSELLSTYVTRTVNFKPLDPRFRKAVDYVCRPKVFLSPHKIEYFKNSSKNY